MKGYFQTHDQTAHVGRLPTGAFPLHVHENVEVVYMATERCTMQIDDTTWELNAGDIAIVFPLVPHGYQWIMKNRTGMMALLLPDDFPEYSRTFRQFVPEAPILRASQLPAEAHDVARRLMAIPSGDPSPLRLAYLHLLLAHVLNALPLVSLETTRARNFSSQMIRYVYEHACERITLATLSQALDVSQSHLSHLFSQQYRINFRRFVNGIRIHKALYLMRDPELSLTDICTACGYDSMRTFRRAFVQETGVLPSEFQRPKAG